jgi:hydrogenase large subunit
MTSVAGGTAFSPDDDRIADLLYRFKKLNTWINGVMIPDTLAIAPFYAGAFEYGGGCGNFLSFGVFNRANLEGKDRYLGAGVLEVSKGLTVADADASLVKEYVTHSWYNSPDGLAPAQGQTKAIDTWDDSTYNLDGQYSWGKAPRYNDLPMEAGPLSRMLVAYLSTNNESHAAVAALVDSALETLGVTDPTKLVSLLGRVAARNLETALISNWTLEWMGELAAAKKEGAAALFEPYSGKEGEGAGLWEAPRGALGHFINIKSGRIDNYQVVTPSTWDLSPRDHNDVPGPVEQALIGTPVMDVTRPIEAARIVRSFDP